MYRFIKQGKAIIQKYIFLQINITTLNRNITTKLPTGDIVNSGRYHGRVFFEIGFKSNDNIFVTVYDKGYSQLDTPLGEKWWEDVPEDIILNKFSDLERHLYRENFESGSYNVVLSPYVAGQLAHEVFGHIFEEDNRYYNENIVNQLSKEQYNQELTIVDDPQVSRGWGSLS
ncbi:metallopeptidase TldD-related protein [Ruminiclostridium josui]|uniref:metallopeptidase TldD-related protein n=1 Tax=Ruminiclostridium josui TaxID=1499 RepID=UPI0006D0B8B8|nr:metallopeptidase TldD-related protein [Ruminiclostridium josui]